jgi:nitrate reductase assembly molybdenum cofactor insertion protein NarJ
MRSQKVLQVVTPAEAGVQKTLERLDSRLRGNDRKKRFSTFYERINTEDLAKSPAEWICHFDRREKSSLFIVIPLQDFSLRSK